MGMQSVVATSDINDNLDYGLSDSSLDYGLADCLDSNIASSNDLDVSDDILNENILSSKDSNLADDSEYIHGSAKNELKSNVLESEDIISNLQDGSDVIIVKSADNYASLSEDIQEIIDSASSGSTIQFIGPFYKELYLKIDKPLNIVSKCGTVINNTQNIPVFDLSSGATGTNITGFTLNLVGSFVEAKDVSKITVSGNTINTKNMAIVFNNVFDSRIQNNNILKFDVGVFIYKSGGITISKNNITPVLEDSIGIYLRSDTSKKGIYILDNRIIGKALNIPAHGIYAYDVENLYMKGNVLSKLDVGMEIPYSLNNFTIHNNTFSSNADGLIIGGWVKNFVFTKNSIVDNVHLGVYFTEDFHGTKGNFTLEKNFFNTNGMDLRDKGDVTVNIGKNFANYRCDRVKMKSTFKVASLVNGNKASFTIVDKNGVAVSGLPNFYAQVTVNGKTYDVYFIEGTGYADVGNGGSGFSSGSSLDIGGDERQLNDWGTVENISLDDILYYYSQYQQLLGISHNDADDDFEEEEYSNSSGSSRNSGSGSGDSGSSDGVGSISSSSSSASSAGASPSSSAAASSSSASPSSESSASAKSLSIDDETFRVVGVGGLVFLIILVIGLYYREDIKDMMEDN